MRSHFNFEVMIVLPQDVFKSSRWGGPEMGPKQRVKIEI